MTNTPAENETYKSVGNALNKSCLGKPDPSLIKYPVAMNVYEKEVWNAAIEAAAKIAEYSETNLTKIIAEDIRSLKK